MYRLLLVHAAHKTHPSLLRFDVLSIELFQIVERDGRNALFGSEGVVGKQGVASRVEGLVEEVRSDRLRFRSPLADVVQGPFPNHFERFFIPARLEQHLFYERNDLREIPLQTVAAQGHRLTTRSETNLRSQLSDGLFELFGSPFGGSFVKHLCGQVSGSDLVGRVMQHTLIQLDGKRNERKFVVFDAAQRHAVAQLLGPDGRCLYLRSVGQQSRFDAAVEGRRCLFVGVIDHFTRFGVQLLLLDALLIREDLCGAAQCELLSVLREDADR